MSESERMLLPLARMRANRLAAALREHVQRHEIVGSIRREREKVGDIELLVEPKPGSPDLFSQTTRPDLERIVRAVGKWGEVLKSGDRYIQLALEDRLLDPEARTKLDIYICHPPAEWGTLLAIRTGPAELGKIAVTRIRKRGWRCKRGAIWRPYTLEDAEAGRRAHLIDPLDHNRHGEVQQWAKVPTPTEEEFFAAADMGCLPPFQRDDLLARIRRLQPA